MSFSTAPGLLIAVPQLTDPNFSRAVVLMIEHDGEGAIGLIINHPTDHACDEVVANFDMTWAGAPDATLCTGGPVEPQSLWILHDGSLAPHEGHIITDGVAFSRGRDTLLAACAAQHRPTRLVIGYAGWGPGQLEQEIAQGSWIIAPATAGLVFDCPADQIWRRALASVGIDPAHLVSASPSVH